MGGLAAGGFELNGCVGDVKALAKSAVDAFENAAAFRHRHLRNGDVAGECVRLRAKTPDVQIVNVEDAFNCGHGITDLTQLQVAGRSFEKDVEGLANDCDGAPENHRGDQDGKYGIDAGEAAEQDGRATCDHRGG